MDRSSGDISGVMGILAVIIISVLMVGIALGFWISNQSSVDNYKSQEENINYNYSVCDSETKTDCWSISLDTSRRAR